MNNRMLKIIAVSVRVCGLFSIVLGLIWVVGSCNATSSSFGLVGGAEIGISAWYGWFVDFELTEE